MYYSGKEELNKKKDTYSSVLSNQGLLFCILLRPSLSRKKKRKKIPRAWNAMIRRWNAEYERVIERATILSAQFATTRPRFIPSSRSL